MLSTWELELAWLGTGSYSESNGLQADEIFYSCW